MKINLEITDASIIFGEKAVEDLNTKELVPKMVLRRRLTRASKLVIELMSKVEFNQGRIIFGTGSINDLSCNYVWPVSGEQRL